MKINITKKEYEKLLDVLYISDWVMHAFYTDKRPETKDYRDLEQKLFSFAKDFGLDNLVEIDKMDEHYYPTRKFEDETMATEFIEEYEEESFWDELIERLAKRDFVEKHGAEAIKLVFENEELFSDLESIKDKYAQEFELNGIEKIRLR